VLLTHHPFQRVGAHAAAALTARATPADITADDLDALAERITSDAVAAGTAVKDGPGWAWLQRLAPCFPNSPATHPMRGGRTGDLRERIAGQFAVDDPSGEPCWVCGAPASQRWGKSLWPLMESAQYLNTSQGGGTGGQPCCRECRIAVWCMPYGAARSRRSLQTVTSSNPAVERAVVDANALVSDRATRERWTSWPQDRHPLDAVLAAVLDVPADCEVQCWVNGNREQSLQVQHLEAGPARWIAGLHAAGQGRLLEDLARAVGREAHPLLYAINGPEFLAAHTRGLSDEDAQAQAQYASLVLSRSEADPSPLHVVAR
jgi:CRISPR-associated protein Cst1